jgi:hypothetical protein
MIFKPSQTNFRWLGSTLHKAVRGYAQFDSATKDEPDRIQMLKWVEPRKSKKIFAARASFKKLLD